MTLALLGGTLGPGALAAEDTARSPGEVPAGQGFVYKTSAGVERRVEVYFPPDHDPSRGAVPGILLFHGGGWRNGSLASFRFAAAYLASRGIVAATAEYQMLDDTGRAALPPGESFKRVCVIDARSALRWFKQNAAELGVDPNRIMAGGGSAGAHLSALATMNPALADPGDPAASDPTVVAYVWFNPAFTAQDEGDPAIDVRAHLRADLPPTVVFFGEHDHWMGGWEDAHARWRARGVETIELWIAPGQPHGFYNREPWRSVTLRAADVFLVNQGLLTGEPTLPPPATGEALIKAP
jgi:acetyl esterase